MPAAVYLGLGANLGDRRQQLQAAIQALEKRLGPLVGCSAFHDTAPVGFDSPHRFLNAAAHFATSLSPAEVLDVTQQVERQLGRTAKSTDGHYADRPIDIDLLLMDDVVLSTPSLVLPHPRLAERRFVLEPLAEVAAHVVVPGLGLTVAQLLRRLNRATIRRVETADEATLGALGRLLPQLSAHAPALTPQGLAAVLADAGTHLYVALDEQGAIGATATLVVHRQLTGTKAWLEDVVVDAACRRRGYARQLIAHIAAEAARLGARSLDLTSRPSRQEAHALYRSQGFEPRSTSVFRLELSAR